MVFSNPIPFAEIPTLALDAVKDTMVELGFSPKAIVDNYNYSFSNHNIHINSMIFADPIHRVPSEYASFTVFNPNNGQTPEEIVRYLSYTSAPFHLIHKEGLFSLWGTKYQNEIDPILVRKDIEYNDLQNVLWEYKEDFNPKRIIDVKRGFGDFSSEIFKGFNTLQLSLWTLDVTQDLLEKYFGYTVSKLRLNQKISENDALDIATQLLGIVILRDTGVLGIHNQSKPLMDLIDTASDNLGFSRFFNKKMLFKHQNIVYPAFDILNQIHYSSFAPDMLTKLYTSAYNEEERRKLGRYDTKLYLTRHIWNNIPVEFLRPEKRIIADMTCGWGSFLISGFERLSSLSDMDKSNIPSYIFGNDVDFFTSKLAQLALITYRHTDNWSISASDALKWNWLASNRPNIIVGNPPFGGDRKTIKAKNREQKADDYLDYAIERLEPNGYLAMLMPQSFVTAEASPQLRKKLLETCDLMELWELPAGTFKSVSQEVIVLFAQKKYLVDKISSFPTRIRNVQKETLLEFQKKSVFTKSILFDSQDKWDEQARASKNSSNRYLIEYRFILDSEIWGKILSNSKVFENVTYSFRGIIRGKKLINKRYLDYQEPKYINWLTGSKNTLPESFVINYENSEKLRYPNDFERPRSKNQNIFEDEKVLLSYIPNPSWGKRVKVGIERQGYYISDSFWIISPSNDSISLEVIAAILDWKVSNAWIIENLKTKGITRKSISHIPFPKKLTNSDIEIITNEIRTIENPDIDIISKQIANQKIDDILRRAYELDDDTYDKLTLIYNWEKSGIITLDDYYDEEPNWIINGITEEVFADKNQVQIWFEGPLGTQIVDISHKMPGWMLRADAAFETKIPRHCVTTRNLENVVWGTFHPQTYTYLDEDEISDELTKLYGGD